jgi:hypothetical protein
LEKRALSPDHLDKIQAYLDLPENLIGPYGSSFQLDLLFNTSFKTEGKVGTYGIINNPQGYIIGRCSNERRRLFEFGFVFEGLILFLTSMGIGTCWLAGTFNRKKLNLPSPLAEGEIIPAITPFGYATESRKLKEKLQRKVIKSDQRKPNEHLFFFDSFSTPLTDQTDLFQKALHNVRIGPSAMNKQPWRLLVSKDLSKVHFYSTREEAHSKSFACPPELLDLGIAYRHFKEGMDACEITGELKPELPDVESPDDLEYVTTWQRK